MKAGHWFTLFIVGFLGILFAVEYSLPKKFIWNPTFGHNDRQPFGCALFDELVEDAWAEEYRLSEETFYQLAEQDTTEHRAYLAIAQYLELGEPDVEAILKLAERGNKVMLASSSFGRLLEDTLGVRSSYSYFNLKGLKKYAVSVGGRDTLCWVGDTARYAPRLFTLYPQLCKGHFEKYDSLATVLARKVTAVEDSVNLLPGCVPVVALSRQVGQGEVILISTPLLLTNYGITDRGNAAIVLRLLSQMSQLPLYRTEAYTTGTQKQESPLRYFLSQPALRWGLYVTILTLVLFMFFTARRRQRAIPVVCPPQNRTMEFTELIGTLYYQQKNQADLVRKKFTYFTEALRRIAQIDVEEEADDDALCRRIAARTGIEGEKIRRLFGHLRPVLGAKCEVSEEQMKEYIDEMSEIMNNL